MSDPQETLDLRRRARRRLVGAIALVLALVIVPPMIMDLEPKPVATKLNVEIPSQDAGRLKPPPKPAITETPAAATAVPDVARTAEKAKTAEKPKAAEPAKGPAPAKPAPSSTQSSLDARTVAALGAPKTPEPAPGSLPAAEEKPKASPKPAEPAAKPSEPARRVADAPPPAGESYVVPLGSYGSAENVSQLRARLAKEGIQSYTEPVKTPSGDRTRVRAGPYPSREAAEEARDRVKAMGIDAGNVIARQ
jgi:DedD protein